MKCYCIAKTENFLYSSAKETVRNTISALENACDKRGIPLLLNEDSSLITAKDMVYRVTMDRHSVDRENKALCKNPKTFYTSGYIDNISSALQLIACYQDIKGISSIMQPFSANKIASLGSFPLVLKKLGRMHGAGVIKVECMEDIHHAIRPGTTYVLQQYFPHIKQGRLIVLGDKVIASHENIVVKDDFRSNAVPEEKRIRKLVTYSQEMQKVAVKAVRCAGVLFGGVDILIDDAGNYAVAEVNFPCYFYRTQELTGVDIAGAMIDYLGGGLTKTFFVLKLF